MLCIRTGTGDSTVLRQVVLRTVNWDTCHNIDNRYWYYLKPDMICAGTVVGGKSSCYGDSGGPLVCKQGDRWFQHGIFNFVMPLSEVTNLCAEPNRPSVYADVVAYQSWIREKSGGLYIIIRSPVRSNGRSYKMLVMFSFFQRVISELPRPITAKLRHMIGTCVDFIN